MEVAMYVMEVAPGKMVQVAVQSATLVIVQAILVQDRVITV